MLIRRSVLEEIIPLGHRHGADDSGTKIELSLRTRFDYVDDCLVERGKPDETLSSSWDHIEGRRYILDSYAGLYEHFPPYVRQRAVSQTHYREGKKRLEEHRWSPQAVVAFARAFRHTSGDRPRYLGACLGSLFGRPGVDTAERLLT